MPENQNPPPSGAARFVPYLVIFVAAIAYYGSYWHFWFNPHDEGGTACLVAQRLMQGERPWVDVEPGYNIGWFYPLVWLFHFTGVNYLAARAWFFALSTVTALLGCGIVSRVTGSRWLGLGTGLLLVVFPGSQFKNYIPLAEAANPRLHRPPALYRPGRPAEVAGRGRRSAAWCWGSPFSCAWRSAISSRSSGCCCCSSRCSIGGCRF
ncbi:MAG: hypothetical protein WDN28_27150 [Chthoniobacter sp.]